MKFLIMFPNGACGNLVAGIIFCSVFDKNAKLHERIHKDGSLHFSNRPWARIRRNTDATTIASLLDQYSILITHNHDMALAFDWQDTVIIKIQIVSDLNASIATKLAIGKNLTGTIEWLYHQSDKTTDLKTFQTMPDVPNTAISVIEETINLSRTKHRTKHNTQCVLFDDIWENPDRFLQTLSTLIVTPISENAKLLLENYREINSKQYEIKI